MRDPWITSNLQSYEGDSRPAHAYLKADGRLVARSRSELLAAVRRRAAGLIDLGLRPGDRVALVSGEPEHFVSVFLAALWVGVVPIPVPPPPLGRRDLWRGMLDGALALTGPGVIVAPEAMLSTVAGMSARAIGYELLDTDALGPAEPVTYRPDHVAYLQFTSGSTGRPRAVVATAGAVTANGLAIMRDGLAVDPESDHALSWLPLHHDMGLVGFLLAPLTVGMPATFLSPQEFVRAPGMWMRRMHEVNGTITFAPNFAYGLAARRVRPDDLAGMDLSRVRVLGCGGEPVNSATLRDFATAYAPAGLDPAAFMPCYGMAESTLAATFAPHDRAPRTDRVSAAALQTAARAVPLTAREEGLEVVSCGSPFPGHEIAAFDGAGKALPERCVGEIRLRGPSIAREYIDDPDATARVFGADGWLRTGDRGYIADGELHVTGRSKDLLIVNGRNIDPQHVEWLAEKVEGVRAGGVVAFTRPGPDTEEAVVVAECRPEACADLGHAVRNTISAQLALAVHDVLAVRPGTVLKTTSGKPRRQQMRRLYLEGALAHRTFDPAEATASVEPAVAAR